MNTRTTLCSTQCLGSRIEGSRNDQIFRRVSMAPNQVHASQGTTGGRHRDEPPIKDHSWDTIGR